MIASQRLTPEEAAKLWIERHPDVWKKWLPQE